MSKLKAAGIGCFLIILISFVGSSGVDANSNGRTPLSLNTARVPFLSLASAEVPELLKDILAGSGSSIAAPTGVEPARFTKAGANLFFVAGNGINGNELWRTDGTPAGTQMVKDIFPGPDSSSAFPHKLVEVAEIIYFAANDGTSGTELWRSDGTEAGTFRVKDISPGSASSNPRELTRLGGALLFTAEDGTTGLELWRSQGSEDSTQQLKDINPGIFGSGPRTLTSVGDALCFFTAGDNTGFELWRTDGTALGTFRAKDIFPFSSSSAVLPLSLIDVGGMLYFLGNDGAGYRLWRSDGSESGTYKVADHVSPHPNDPHFATMVDFAGTLFFTGQAPASNPYGLELWRSDGTPAGTYMIKDIRPGTETSFPQDLFFFDGALYFRANDGTSGVELWKSDGTEAGTFRLKDIVPGINNSNPDYFVNVGGKLLFTAHDAFGIEIWRSDGTEAGTARVTDILPGSASASPLVLTPLGTTLVFTANDGTHGREPWAISMNLSPTAANDSAVTNEDTSVMVNILANDIDPDSDALTVNNVTQGFHGSVVLNPDNTVTYIPFVNFFGSDSFTYTISDGHGGTATGTVNVTVDSVNDAPTAGDSAAILNEDTQIEITLVASDIDSTSLNFVLVSGPVNGVLSAIVNGKVIYTPDPNYSGSDCFSFIASDGITNSEVAAISLTVAPTADPPVLAMIGDQVVTEGALLSLTLSATDPDNEQLTFTVSGLPEGAIFDPMTQSFSWTPNSDQAGTYSVVFTVTDPTGRSASESITITVADVVTNLGPACSAASPSISEIWPPDGRVVPISILGITDPDNDPVTILIRQILQDEPTNTFGDGNTWIDGGGVGESGAWIRAERSGARRVAANGRVYEIFFEASDGRGKSCTGSVKVSVPHDEGRGPAVDDGKRYDSTVAGGPCLNCNP